MSTSLYDLSVVSFLQTLGAVAGFLEKGHAHFTANGTDPNEVVEARLSPTCCRSAFRCRRSRITRWAPSKA